MGDRRLQNVYPSIVVLEVIFKASAWFQQLQSDRNNILHRFGDGAI